MTRSTLDVYVTCSTIELRAPTPRHAPQLWRLTQDPRVSRFVDWSPHADIDQTLRFLRNARSHWQAGSIYTFGVFSRAGNDLLGMCSLSGLHRDPQVAEVGTWLGHEHQGHGLNRQVKGAAFELAFDHLGLRRLEMLVRPRNLRAIAACRRLPGVRGEGRRDGQLLFALEREWWDRDRYPTALVLGAAARATV